jgi:hypothetical protein
MLGRANKEAGRQNPRFSQELVKRPTAKIPRGRHDPVINLMKRERPEDPFSSDLVREESVWKSVYFWFANWSKSAFRFDHGGFCLVRSHRTRIGTLWRILPPVHSTIASFEVESRLFSYSLQLLHSATSIGEEVLQQINEHANAAQSEQTDEPSVPVYEYDSSAKKRMKEQKPQSSTDQQPITDQKWVKRKQKPQRSRFGVGSTFPLSSQERRSSNVKFDILFRSKPTRICA